MNFDLNLPEALAHLDTLLNEGRTLVAKVKAEKVPTYANVVDAMVVFDNRLHRFWAPISHLNSVKNSDALRPIYEAGLAKLTDYGMEVSQDEGLFYQYESISKSADFKALSPAQQKVIEHALRDFRLSGVALPAKEKAEFKKMETALSDLATRFEQHLMDAIDAWSYHTNDVSELEGLPAHLLDQAREKAKPSGYTFGLDAPTYMVIMSYAKNRTLREHFYRAFVTRASNLGDPAFDNSQLMVEILKLRQAQAKLLHFKDYSHYALEGKMAPSLKTVIHFLEGLACATKKAGAAEIKALQTFAESQGFVGPLQSYDIPYYAERMKESLFGFSEEDLRPYFPISRVRADFFAVLQEMFGLTFRKKEIPAWHPDVEFFEVFDESGALRGGIYMDLYAREKKRSGAWMDDAEGRLFKLDVAQHPKAFLTANFLRGKAGEESFLTHDDVITLFHEMGHVLQHVLTQVDEPAVSGISGVAWDAVEFPSQFIEHFAWSDRVLSALAPDLKAQLLQSRVFHGALQMLRQLEFALFDLTLHQSHQIKTPADIDALLNQVRAQVSVIKAPEYNRFPQSFSHIFAGGYASLYYSYKWAEVLSCDAFLLFDENKEPLPILGKRFRETVLELGGSVDAMDVFVAFRGREPNGDALLKYAGIV